MIGVGNRLRADLRAALQEALHLLLHTLVGRVALYVLFKNTFNAAADTPDDRAAGNPAGTAEHTPSRAGASALNDTGADRGSALCHRRQASEIWIPSRIDLKLPQHDVQRRQRLLTEIGRQIVEFSHGGPRVLDCRSLQIIWKEGAILILESGRAHLLLKIENLLTYSGVG